MPAPSPRLDFWFEFGSPYSYLAVMRIEELARAAGVSLAWQPFLLGPVFRQFGWPTSPFVLQEAKGKYMWRDMERQAAKYGLPFVRPSRFPRSAVLPMRVAAFAADQPWIGTFCRRVMRQHWVDDLDIDDERQVRLALDGLVADPGAAIDAALGGPGPSPLRRNTEAAFAKGIFGAPTFFVGDEMFWGNDRLDDALAFAVSSSKARAAS